MKNEGGMDFLLWGEPGTPNFFGGRLGRVAWGFRWDGEGEILDVFLFAEEWISRNGLGDGGTHYFRLVFGGSDVDL
jgi:hypothetical protein